MSERRHRCERIDGSVAPLLAAFAEEISKANASHALAVHAALLWNCGQLKTESILQGSGGPDGMRTIFLVVDDFEGRLRSDPTRHVILRTSVSYLELQRHELVLPYLFEPLPAPFPPKPRGDMPAVGFCGLDHVSRKGPTERGILLDALAQASRDRLLNATLVRLDSFWGGKPGDPAAVEAFRRNMEGSHFNVASRGVGNFAMRLYQTLSAGRVPVLASSTIVLPLAWAAPWRQCIVLERSAEAAVATLLRLWGQGDEIVARQRRCARLHERFFSFPPGTSFARHVVHRLWSRGGHVTRMPLPLGSNCSAVLDPCACCRFYVHDTSPAAAHRNCAPLHTANGEEGEARALHVACASEAEAAQAGVATRDCGAVDAVCA